MMSMRATDTLKKLLGPTQDFEATSPAVTIRYARPDDALALLHLAELDSSIAPVGRNGSAIAWPSSSEWAAQIRPPTSATSTLPLGAVLESSSARWRSASASSGRA